MFTADAQMATLHTTQDPIVFAGSRLETVLAFAGNVVVPVSAFLGLNAGANWLGLPAPALTFSESIGIGGELVALSWLFALASWGLVRFALGRRGAAGGDAVDWLAMLLAATVAFPFMTLGFDFFWTTVAAFGLGLLAIGTLIRVARVSFGHALLMLPAIAAILVPAVVGFGVLAMGWTPPFGATQASEPPVAPTER